MRYDTPIYFQSAAPRVYDPTTGDWSDETPVEVKAYAAVMDTREETVKLLYGAIRQGSLTVHIQNHYEQPFTTIRVGSKPYKVDFRRRLRVKESFILSEVQNGAQ